MFRKTIETEVTISSSSQRVWDILTDFNKYGEWNDFITSITLKDAEELRVGDRLHVTVQIPGGGKNSFSPRVLKASRAKELRWQGTLPIPGLFTGQHYFIMVPTGASDTTKLVHGENFHGLLVPLIGGLLEKTRKGFTMMNSGLKERAELR
jgi:hypothetical protein